MTSAQLEPSAHAPCTSTTLRATAGFAVCADASAAKSIVESTLTATTTHFRPVFICRTPYESFMSVGPSFWRKAESMMTLPSHLVVELQSPLWHLDAV